VIVVVFCPLMLPAVRVVNLCGEPASEDVPIALRERVVGAGNVTQRYNHHGLNKVGNYADKRHFRRSGSVDTHRRDLLWQVANRAAGCYSLTSHSLQAGVFGSREQIRRRVRVCPGNGRVLVER
jgi:hypothetical protein